MSEPEERLPVIILAGFLGSGKTTLVNRILTDPRSGRFAVLVNEFGDVGIDGRLVIAAEEDLVELANGCVCCTVRGDLERGLVRLLEGRGRILGREPFDGVLIEASGLASPGPIAQTLEIVPDLRAALFLRGIVTLAHAGRIIEQLAGFSEAAEQVGYADLLVLNHADRTSEEGLDAARAALAKINQAAPIVTTERAELELVLLDELERGGLGETASADSGSEHGHTSDVATMVLTTEAPLDLHRLKMWLRFLETRPDGEVLRIKGILACEGRARSVVVQGVYQWLEIGPGDGPPPPQSQLVLIGRGFPREQLRRGWQAIQADGKSAGV